MTELKKPEIIMKKTVITLFILASILCGAIMISYAGELLGEHQTPIPASMDGKAYEIVFTREHKPQLRTIATSLPVLFYAGKSKNGAYQSYTSLAAYDETAHKGHREVTIEQLATNPTLRLVPTGDLQVEDRTGNRWQINDANQYVISAAWSPSNSDVLAFTFSSGSDYGIAIANVKSKRVQILRSTSILPDRIAWSPSGTAIQFYEEDEQNSHTNGFITPHYTLAQETVTSTKQEKLNDTWSLQLPQPKDDPSTPDHQAFSIALPDGTQFKGDNLLGGSSALTLINPEGSVIKKTQVDIIVGVSLNGMAFKKVIPGGMELDFMDRQGHLYPLASTLSSVTYRLPFFAFTTPTITVTQVGSGFSTQCNLFDHTGNMAYAYDMQARPGSETIEASADGTVSYLASFVTCNSADNGSDGSPCTDYSQNCNSNGGWGNVVIIQHADGTWTKYTHLKAGSVLPPSTGVSVGFGCEIAREGHTGYTIGNKNGCGDHLHFQRQTSSSLNGVSTSISFSDQTNPLRCTTYTSGNTGRSCLFL
jgi:hypothetical protein